MTRFILLLCLAIGGCREASGDDDKQRHDPAVAHETPSAPCAGCTLDVPTRSGVKPALMSDLQASSGRSAATPARDLDGPIPLLVVFHGDGEDADAAAKRWRAPALERGWAVLSLQCPKSEGCDGRWYKWNGHPRWVSAQIAAVRRQLEIDPARVFLAGWSGGATYIGMNAPRWSYEPAAVVFHGGGQPPLATRECPTRGLPAYFLVGDKNWAHGAARRLRGYYERCGVPHVWDLLEGANHPAEDKALTHDKAKRILDWLDAHAQRSLVSTR